MARKSVIAHGLNRVEIAHHDQGRFRMFLTELADKCHRLAQGRTIFQSANASALDRWAIGHRVCERKTQLDHIDTCAR